MNICLVAIVRDEAHVIRRCLESVKPLLSHWTICDTGSSDRTCDLIRETMVDVPGELHEREWVNFGHNQTEMLELAAGKSDYLLHLGADESVYGQIPDTLDQPSYAITIRDGGPLFTFPRLLKDGLDWRYVGAAHAYPTSTQQPVPGQTLLEGFEILHHGDGHRRQTGTRFEQTRELLEAELAEQPDNPRTVYYLANTYRDLGRYDEALPLYRRRSLMGGWGAEAQAAREQAEKIESGDLSRVGVPSLV